MGGDGGEGGDGGSGGGSGGDGGPDGGGGGGGGPAATAALPPVSEVCSRRPAGPLGHPEPVDVDLGQVVACEAVLRHLADRRAHGDLALELQNLLAGCMVLAAGLAWTHRRWRSPARAVRLVRSGVRELDVTFSPSSPSPGGE